MKRKPYLEYKASGNDWIGPLPKGWFVRNLQVVANLKKYSFVDGPFGSDLKNEEYVDEGIPLIQLNNIGIGNHIINNLKYVTEEKAKSLSKHNAFPGDIVIAKMADPVARAAIVCEAYPLYLIVADCIRLSVNNNYDPRYVTYWINSSICRAFSESISSGTTRLRVNLGGIKKLPLLVFEHQEQQKIANFLDRETAKLDTLIAKQEKLIELLQEKRQAIISHAVTKGLDPNVKMKNSGVEWLGMVPEHWEIHQTKRIFKLVVDVAPDNNNHELLSIYTEIGVRPRKELEEKGNKASSTDGYFIVKKGDFIVNKLLAWMGAIGLSNYDGVTSPAYDILRPFKTTNQQYYDFLFRCGVMFTEFRKYSRGIMDMRLRLYFEEFGQLNIPYPPPEEQKEISNWLSDKTSKIDFLVEKSKQSIELAKEHRTALISAAVTGKIDVRDYA